MHQELLENIFEKQIAIQGALPSISPETQSIMTEQSRKCICKIKNKNKEEGSGFLCLIPFPFPEKDKLLGALITNNHVLGENDIMSGKKINFSINNEDKNYEILIDDSRKVYTSQKYDVTIIEIKKNEQGLDYNTFLQVDDIIYEEISEERFKNFYIYIIHYPKGIKLAISAGKTKGIEMENFNIEHLCNTESGSSGSPLINYETNRVIGVHKEGSKKVNRGTFLKEPIKEFYENNKNKLNLDDIILIKDLINNLYNNNNNKKHFDYQKYKKILLRLIVLVLLVFIILLLIFILSQVNNNKKKEDKYKNNCEIGKEDKCSACSEKKNECSKCNYRYILKDGKCIANFTFWAEYQYCKYFDCYLINNIPASAIITKMIVNGQELDFIKEFETTNFDNTKIYFLMEPTHDIRSLEEMFYQIKNLVSIYFTKSFFTENVIYMNSMFEKCVNLVSIDISNFNTSNVRDISSMFSGDKELTSINLNNFDISKVTNLKYVFDQCTSLQSLNLSSFKNVNTNDISSLFKDLKSLQSIDLSNLNTSNIEYMESMFRGCASLKSIDLSNFNTHKVKSFSDMFNGCELLKSVNFGNFNTSNSFDMSRMFYNCKSLSSLNLTSFNLSNVQNINQMFRECKSLNSIEFSTYITTPELTNMFGVFFNCGFLASIDLSHFNFDKIVDMDNLFTNCQQLTFIDFSSFNIKSNINAKDIFLGISPSGTIKIQKNTILEYKIPNGWVKIYIDDFE